MSKCRGIDANSFTREYARKVMLLQLPIPHDDIVRIVPLGDENVVTAADFVKMCAAGEESFRNSKEAN